MWRIVEHRAYHKGLVMSSGFSLASNKPQTFKPHILEADDITDIMVCQVLSNLKTSKKNSPKPGKIIVYRNLLFKKHLKVFQNQEKRFVILYMVVLLILIPAVAVTDRLVNHFWGGGFRKESPKGNNAIEHTTYSSKVFMELIGVMLLIMAM